MFSFSCDYKLQDGGEINLTRNEIMINYINFKLIQELNNID